MRKKFLYALVTVLFASLFAPQSSQADEGRTEISGEYAADRIIVTYADNSTSVQNFQVREKSKRDVEASSSEAISPGQDRTQVIRIGSKLTVTEAINRLRNQPGVIAVQPDYKVYALDLPPTDSYFASSQLWGMYGPNTVPSNNFGSNATSAWGRGYTGSSTVAVGIVDEGIQITHPELAQNIWVNPREIAGNRIDDDRNGYIDDINGWDFFNNDNTVFDGTTRNTTLDAHGTHVSGTIGARPNNGTGVAGVNWNVKIISAKFLGATGGYTSGAVAALNYLTNLKLAGVPIVASNNSWGGGGFDQALLDAINRGADAGILFVAAAGNAAGNNDVTMNYPSNYVCDGPAHNRGWDCVIAVSSINSAGNLSTFSNYGASTVDIGAPGEGIWSSVPNNSFASYSGTSMATPHVTGAVALCASMGMTSAQAIKATILNSAAPTPSLSGKTLTGGRLNLDAMTSMCSGLNAQSPLTIDNTTLSAAPGSQVRLTSTGGSGSGVLSYQTSTAGCAIANGDSLTATTAVTCLVYAVKGASTGFTAATSPAKTFTFAVAAQPTLVIANTILSNAASTVVRLSTTGGAGTGAVSYRVTGAGCAISNVDSLSVTSAPTTCVVTATKAASPGYALATSATKSFAFTALAQTPLTITNVNRTNLPRAQTVPITVSGGNGTATLRFSVSGTNCSINATSGVLTTASRAATCTVTVNKAASGIYLAATSVTGIFTFQ